MAPRDDVKFAEQRLIGSTVHSKRPDRGFCFFLTSAIGLSLGNKTHKQSGDFYQHSGNLCNFKPAFSSFDFPRAPHPVTSYTGTSLRLTPRTREDHERMGMTLANHIQIIVNVALPLTKLYKSPIFNRNQK